MILSLLLRIYTLLYSLALLFLLPYEYFKRPKWLRKRWLKERFGRIPDIQTSEFKTVWVHAVSVGEVIASIPFIQEMMKRYPSINLVLTTVTDTGQKVAKDRLSGHAILYMPFDLPFSINRFVKAIKPSLYVSIETEIWPNLFHRLKRSDIPVVIMNGRVSDDSFRGYKKIGFFIKRVLEDVDLFCMQEDIYGERVKALGAPVERIRITGNFKFDIRIEEHREEWVRQLHRPLILAGSTHEGEEEIVLDACKRLEEEIGNMTLIIAPRHPERFAEVEDILNKRGIRYIKRSEIEHRYKDSDIRVILIDLIGELASLYSICDIAIIGGSFSARGGHNPLEPAFWGKPIICGEDMSNFPFIEEFYKNSAALKTSGDRLYNDLKGLVTKEEERHNMGNRAREMFRARAGAIMRSVDALKCYLEPS